MLITLSVVLPSASCRSLVDRCWPLGAVSHGFHFFKNVYLIYTNIYTYMHGGLKKFCFFVTSCAESFFFFLLPLQYFFFFFSFFHSRSWNTFLAITCVIQVWLCRPPLLPGGFNSFTLFGSMWSSNSFACPHYNMSPGCLAHNNNKKCIIIVLSVWFNFCVG